MGLCGPLSSADIVNGIVNCAICSLSIVRNICIVYTRNMGELICTLGCT